MNYIAFLLVGLISGFFIGLIGIGSGVIVVPGLTMAGMTVKQAITTGLMLQAVPQTIPGFLIYHDNGHFKWEESILTLIGSFFGVVIGASMSYYSFVSDENMYRLLSIILVISGCYVYYKNILNPPLKKEVKQANSP